jgi:DNA-binding GntR family transcriptional regulator
MSQIVNESTSQTGETLQQQVYLCLKQRILNMDYKPGQQLFDTQIADELGFSRTPVRDAMRQLEHEGLLVSQARQGWRVYSLSIDDIHQIFDIKMAVEGMVVRRAAKCTDEKLRAALKETMQRMKATAQAGDFDAWMQADTQMHDIFFAMGPNERATRIVKSLNEQWFRLRIGFMTLHGRMQRSCQEHEPVVDSILAGNEDEAERCMRSHIEHVHGELVNLLVKMVLPFTEGSV